MKTVLVTGGTGFIGSHTCVQLLQKNYKVIIVDNLSNSKIDVLESIKNVSKSDNIIFYNRNITNDDCSDIFSDYKIYAVIHFAGLKSVNESVNNPLYYYHTNIMSTINILKSMKENGCKNLVFSSSATVYGNSLPPFKEESKTGVGISNPYGKTKYMLEEILIDYSKINKDFNIVILRYFNPIGAHPSGLLGENPNNIPNNLMPYILKVAYKHNIDKNMQGYDSLAVYGNDYDTRDGSCIRDYIHVLDLADSHLLSIEKIDIFKNNLNIFNIGMGNGTSVLEIINIFEKVNNIKVPYNIVERREGDVPISYCKNDKSIEFLDFKPKKTIEDMCKDAWNYCLINNEK